MRKTTVYLPDGLKRDLTRSAGQRRVSEAEFIRSALQAAVQRDRPAPAVGLFETTDPIAARADELLAGFGDR